MKVLSKIKLLFTPSEDDDAVNKKYVDKTIGEKIKTSSDDAGFFTCVDNDGNIISTNFDSSTILYSQDIDPTDNVVDESKDADTLHGLTWDKFALNEHTHDSEDVGLGNLTNDKQVKAVFDATVNENHVVVWEMDNDGSRIKDSGFTLGCSVPSDAKFTDTTYNITTDTESGLFSPDYKKKIDDLDLSNQIMYFDSVEDLKNYDMSDYKHDYAYGVVGTTQYRWKSTNDELSSTGKWRINNDSINDSITLNGFKIDENGILYAKVTQTNNETQTTIESEDVIGRIALNPRGEYNNTETYNKLDLVVLNGIMYICLKDNTTTIRPSDTNYWFKASEKPLDAYDLYCENTDDDPVKSYDEWYESIKGQDGKDGISLTNAEIDEDGYLVITTVDPTANSDTTDNDENDDESQSNDGVVVRRLGRVKGESAYEVACNNGFRGTEDEWLDSLVGVGGQLSDQANTLANKRNINGMMFDGSKDITNFVICSSPADSQEKAISLENYALANGATLYVQFENGNTATNISINVNNTLPHPLYKNDELYDASSLKKNSILILKYMNRTFFVCNNSSDSPSTPPIQISSDSDNAIVENTDGIFVKKLKEATDNEYGLVKASKVTDVEKDDYCTQIKLKDDGKLYSSSFGTHSTLTDVEIQAVINSIF